MRQFGFVQPIPSPCNTDMRLHSYNLRGKHERNWVEYLTPQIRIWNERQNNIIHGRPIFGGPNVEPAYEQWFANISRRYITKAGASFHYLVRIYIYHVQSSYIYTLIFFTIVLICFRTIYQI